MERHSKLHQQRYRITRSCEPQGVRRQLYTSLYIAAQKQLRALISMLAVKSQACKWKTEPVCQLAGAFSTPQQRIIGEEQLYKRRKRKTKKLAWDSTNSPRHGGRATPSL